MFKNLPKNSPVPYFVALMTSYIIWAAAGPVIKLTLEYIPPYTFLFLRFLIVCTLLLPFTYYQLKTTRIYREDYFKILILGIFSQTSIIFIFLGLERTTALEATLIGLIGPIMSVAAGHYFYNEKIDWRVKLGLCIAIIGTIFVALEPILFSLNNNIDIKTRMIGNLFVLLNSLMFLLYVIWSKISMGENTLNTKRLLHLVHIKPMKKLYPTILLTTMSFYVGFATMIPFALLENFGYLGTRTFQISSLNFTAIAGLAYMALLSSIVAYILFEWSLKKIAVKETALFSYLQPIFTMPFAWLLLREFPDIYMVIGSLVIAIGVVIAEKRKS